MEYVERDYRNRLGAPRDGRQEGPVRFRNFSVRYLETDLWIGVDPGSWKDSMPAFVSARARYYRGILDAYGAARPEFLSSHIPLDTDGNAPEIARAMMEACIPAGVGPMAAVAGAVAASVARDLEAEYGMRELVVENGGDMYLRFTESLDVAVFAGASKLSELVGVTIGPELSPLGVCTSSGTVGPSFSYGKADAAMVACRDPARADAWATALGNAVKEAGDIDAALSLPFADEEVLSVMVVVGDRMGIRGALPLRLFEGARPSGERKA